MEQEPLLGSKRHRKAESFTGMEEIEALIIGGI